jgi:hypothetical protein
MILVSPSSLAAYKNLTVNLSNTLRNETVDLQQYASSGFVMDVNGSIYTNNAPEGDTVTLVVIGGSDLFIGEKVTRLASSFYISEPQKVMLYKVIKELSNRYDSGNITSNNDKLELSLTALYKNYCG